MAKATKEFPQVTRTGPDDFRIAAAEWNDVCQWLSDHMPVMASPGTDAPFFPHPWFTDARWDDVGKEFVATTRPGFIRGHDAYVHTLGRLLSGYSRRVLANTEEGVPGDDERVQVALSDEPEYRIPTRTWKIVAGPDEYEVAGEDKAPVPEVFHAKYGVAVNSVIRVDTEALTIETDEGDAEQARRRGNTRSLARCELVLNVPRPRVEAVEVGDPTLGVTLLDLQVRYVEPDGDNPCTLQVVTDLPLMLQEGGTTLAQSIQEALEQGDDRPVDQVHVATLWAISPQKFRGDEVTGEWRVLVQHHEHWNLDYTVNAQVNRVPPLRFVNPALGLIGGEAAQGQVDTLNAQQAEVEALFNSVQVTGEFWSY